MAKILRKCSGIQEAQFPIFFCWPKKSIFRHYCIDNIEDGLQIRVYEFSRERVTNFSQFIAVNVKKSLSNSKTQFREKLRILRLRKNDVFC